MKYPILRVFLQIYNVTIPLKEKYIPDVMEYLQKWECKGK